MRIHKLRNAFLQIFLCLALVWVSGCSKYSEPKPGDISPKTVESVSVLKPALGPDKVKHKEFLHKTSELSTDVSSDDRSPISPNSVTEEDFASPRLAVDNLKGVDRLAVSEYTKLVSLPVGKVLPAPECKLDSLSISNIRFDRTEKVLGSGSKTTVVEFKRESVNSHFLPKKVAVKFLDSTAGVNAVKGLMKEKAFLSLFSKIPQFAKMFVPKVVPPICENRVLVTSVEGSTDLGALKKTNKLGMIAVQAIQLVRIVHERGFVHGDIHMKQFVLDLAHPSTSLRLLDFGRAIPYLTDSGEHVPEKKVKAEMNWNSTLLSVFELGNFPKTRRDDFFRLAEMFLRKLPKGDSVFMKAMQKVKEEFKEDKPTQRLKILEMKKNRFFPDNIPKVFKLFYTYTLGLAHDERPDYEGWIDQFNKYAHNVV